MKQILKIILQKLKQSIYVLLYNYYCNHYELEKDKILFLSASRSKLSGNFEFVYNELKRRDKYKLNMVLKPNLKAKYSLKEKKELCYLMATSKYIFLDDFYPIIYAMKLRKDQELIQLWHAMGAFKRVGYSRGANQGAPTKYSLTHKNYTAAICSSKSIRKDYAEAFGISIDKIKALGIPRTDIFFDKSYKEKTISKLYEKYPMLKSKKIILFAPTFRGNGQKTAYYNFDWIDFKKLKEEFQDEYICIIKLHPFIKNKPDYDFESNPFYIDMTDMREINDLLFITDTLITDYSSVIFEYSFMRKPIIFYLPDLDEYKKSRDFYYELDKYTYGSVVTSFDNLIEAIKEQKIEQEKLKEFYEYFCSSCDGASTKRVVDYFIK